MKNNLNSIYRGATPLNHGGLGQDRPSEPHRNDTEYQMYRKRMMLAYRFRPNPLVRTSISFFLVINTKTSFVYFRTIHDGIIINIDFYQRFISFVYNRSNLIPFILVFDFCVCFFPLDCIHIHFNSK
jgi:hypothetical protein